MSDNDKPINPADIRRAAMDLLARREHSLRELRDKLKRRFPDDDLLIQELERLRDEHLQSDERFAQSFARQRVLRGQGPLRIRQEMRQRGLSDSEIALAMESLEVDWFELAAEVLEKKFGGIPADDMKDKARRMRFMQYRGFSMEHFQDLLP